MQGIINIYKPQDFTSHDCVAIVRRVSGVKKTGHTGTLDPMATGVLPVCIGKATRVIQYMDEDTKEYICTMRLGIRTDTLDVWGTILEEKPPVSVSKEEAAQVLKGFEGRILQTPPKYSAIKVNGKKLYEYARAGKEVEIKPREVFIHKIDVLDVTCDTISFKMCCGKGTYVRSVCDDAGKILGCGAAMSSLVRSRSGMFCIEDAVDIRDVKEMTSEKLKKLLTRMDEAVGFRKVYVSGKAAEDLADGKRPQADKSIVASARGSSSADQPAENEKLRIYHNDGFIGICRYEDGLIIPEKIFRTKNDQR